MCIVPNTAGSISSSDASWEIADTTDFASRKELKALILKANTVPLSKVFKLYGIKLDEYNRQIRCPFSSHKFGRESSASFLFYPKTNSFWCFGCKTGIYTCDFVSNMDNCNKFNAAKKVLKLFESDVDDDNILNQEDFSERLEILMEFSNYIRDIIKNDNLIKGEELSKVFDALNLKHDLSNLALKSVIEQLKKS